MSIARYIRSWSYLLQANLRGTSILRIRLILKVFRQRKRKTGVQKWVNVLQADRLIQRANNYKIIKRKKIKIVQGPEIEVISPVSQIKKTEKKSTWKTYHPQQKIRTIFEDDSVACRENASVWSFLQAYFCLNHADDGKNIASLLTSQNPHQKGNTWSLSMDYWKIIANLTQTSPICRHRNSRHPLKPSSWENQLTSSSHKCDDKSSLRYHYHNVGRNKKI